MIPANPILDIVAVLVAVLGAGRLTRVITYDDYPPSVWVRNWWRKVTRDGGWSKLASCFWCASPWVMLVCMGTGLISFNQAWEPVWWLFWGWLALSYVTAMVIARDEPNS